MLEAGQKKVSIANETLKENSEKVKTLANTRKRLTKSELPEQTAKKAQMN